MVEWTVAGLRPVAAPSLVPEACPIDLAHLSRMTMNDRELEREVLALFDRQMGMIMERIESATPPVAAAAAHTLKGSASGIGAWQVVAAAAAVENAAKGRALSDWPERIAGLNQAVRQARCGISEILDTE